jgi:RimJ/RimL family protein N-acetyltransferase
MTAFHFAPLTDAHLPMLHAWMGRPHWQRWWGPQPSLAEVVADYAPRVDGSDRTRCFIAHEAQWPGLVSQPPLGGRAGMAGPGGPHEKNWLCQASQAPLGGRAGVAGPGGPDTSGEPIGFIQVYVPMREGDGWWEDETDPGARGIDQSLADERRLGQGLGRRMIAAFVDQVFADPAVTVIQTDPHPTNERAIRCYRAVGFVDHARVTTPDGPALLMKLSRQRHAERRGMPPVPAHRLPGSIAEGPAP